MKKAWDSSDIQQKKFVRERSVRVGWLFVGGKELDGEKRHYVRPVSAKKKLEGEREKAFRHNWKKRKEKVLF